MTKYVRTGTGLHIVKRCTNKYLSKLPCELDGTLLMIDSPDVTSLRGMPQKIMGSLHINGTGIEDFDGIGWVHGDIHAVSSKLCSLRGLPIEYNGTIDIIGTTLSWNLKLSTIKFADLSMHKKIELLEL